MAAPRRVRTHAGRDRGHVTAEVERLSRRYAGVERGVLAKEAFPGLVWRDPPDYNWSAGGRGYRALAPDGRYLYRHDGGRWWRYTLETEF